MVMQEEMTRAKSLQSQIKVLEAELEPLKERFLEALTESEAVEQGPLKLKLVHRMNTAWKGIVSWIREKECTYCNKQGKAVHLNNVLGSVIKIATKDGPYVLVQD